MSQHGTEQEVMDSCFRAEVSYQQQLQAVARSVDLELSDGLSLQDLVQRWNEAGVDRVGWVRWLDSDREAIEIIQPKGMPAGSIDEQKDRTILYWLIRKETTDIGSNDSANRVRRRQHRTA